MSSRLRVSPFGLLATPWQAAGFARQISEPALARVVYGSRAAYLSRRSPTGAKTEAPGQQWKIYWNPHRVRVA